MRISWQKITLCLCRRGEIGAVHVPTFRRTLLRFSLGLWPRLRWWLRRGLGLRCLRLGLRFGLWLRLGLRRWGLYLYDLLNALAPSYAVAPIRLCGKLFGGETPQASSRRPSPFLSSKEAVHVLHVGREGGDLSVALPKQRLVEHLTALRIDIGEEPVVAVCFLHIEL